VLVRCLAHGDRTPSCSVSRGGDGTVQVRCFGCELAGDALHLVAAVYDLDTARDFQRVLQLGAELAGLTLEAPGSHQGPRRAPPPRRAPAPEAPLAQGLPLDVFAELARAFIAHASLDGPHGADVRAYLDGRGILATARRDGWGALPASETGRADVRARIINAVGLDAWERSGLAWGAGWKWERHRIVIPWCDTDGRITWLQRRGVGAVEGPRYAAPSNAAPTAPYGAEHFAAAEDLDATVAVVDGAVDALALRAACERDGADVVILGAPGVKGWQRAWSPMLAGRCVALAFAADDAGDAAAEELGAELADVAASTERWRPEGAKDWGEAWERRAR